jgi:hypothetical protein
MDGERREMSRQLLLGLGFLLLTGAAVGILAWGQPSDAGLSSQQRAEAESFRVLARARSIQELEQAAGNLGVVLRLRDGGWIAIRYQDSHADSAWSSAVARDSHGAWFVSTAHHCGRFAAHRLWRERRDGPGDWDLRDLEDGTLDVARVKLGAIGFQRVPAPAP